MFVIDVHQQLCFGLIFSRLARRMQWEDWEVDEPVGDGTWASGLTTEQAHDEEGLLA
jgi:hypothetical protein